MADEPAESWIEKQERMKKADRPYYISVIVMFFGLLALIVVLNKVFLGWGFSELGWTTWGFIVSLLALPLFFLGAVWWTWDDKANEREAGRVAEKERKERQAERKRKYGPPVDRSKADEWAHTTVTLEPGDLEKYGDEPPDYEEEDDTGPPYPPLRRVKKEGDIPF